MSNKKQNRKLSNNSKQNAPHVTKVSETFKLTSDTTAVLTIKEPGKLKSIQKGKLEYHKCSRRLTISNSILQLWCSTKGKPANFKGNWNTLSKKARIEINAQLMGDHGVTVNLVD